ncbi:hypothetical protein ASPFODRAFT_66571 [Aspergillus luchuensis CBS 106.47]|uniref:Uncharacterized protein n=1 Tax=Aspergillus luchuensis (strain CBS 106.47) TaxID=1137211 RepID=A0A1M3TZ85_ASPLC|nr:hypothetical protein ASPFODRAFT_66571 [Aspergillus luchuensis CBS 106.47]
MTTWPIIKELPAKDTRKRTAAISMRMLTYTGKKAGTLMKMAQCIRHDMILTHSDVSMVEPNIAEIINYTPTIQVLERHATIEASDRLEATEVLKARFDMFLHALKAAEYPGNYLNLMSPEYHQFKELRSAYREFWNAT